MQREREASRGDNNGETAAEKAAVGESESATARAAEGCGVGDEGEETGGGGGGGGGHEKVPLCMAIDAPKERREEGLQNPYLSDKVSPSSRFSLSLVGPWASFFFVSLLVSTS